MSFDLKTGAMRGSRESTKPFVRRRAPSFWPFLVNAMPGLAVTFSPTSMASGRCEAVLCGTMPQPNKRLKLTGGDRFEGSGVLCPGGHGLSLNTLAPADESPAA